LPNFLQKLYLFLAYTLFFFLKLFPLFYTSKPARFIRCKNVTVIRGNPLFRSGGFRLIYRLAQKLLFLRTNNRAVFFLITLAAFIFFSGFSPYYFISPNYSSSFHINVLLLIRSFSDAFHLLFIVLWHSLHSLISQKNSLFLFAFGVFVGLWFFIIAKRPPRH